MWVIWADNNSKKKAVAIHTWNPTCVAEKPSQLLLRGRTNRQLGGCQQAGSGAVLGVMLGAAGCCLPWWLLQVLVLMPSKISLQPKVMRQLVLLDAKCRWDFRELIILLFPSDMEILHKNLFELKWVCCSWGKRSQPFSPGQNKVTACQNPQKGNHY